MIVRCIHNQMLPIQIDFHVVFLHKKFECKREASCTQIIHPEQSLAVGVITVKQALMTAVILERRILQNRLALLVMSVNDQILI